MVMFRQVLFLSISWAAITLIPLTATRPKANEIHLSSPNGNVSVTFAVKERPTPYPKGRRPYYTVLLKGRVVVRESPLGLVFEGGEPLERHFKLVG